MISVPLGRLAVIAGEARTELLLVHSGLLSFVGEGSQDGQFAEPGSFFGLGCMPHHTCTARAIADTVIHAFPLTAFDALCRRFPQLRQQSSDAIAREFVLVRRAALAAPTADEKRLAALLVVLSRINGYEGRPSATIGDDLNCAAVADQLEWQIDRLATALDALAAKGLVAPSAKGGGIVLRDLAALDRLSD